MWQEIFEKIRPDLVDFCVAIVTACVLVGTAYARAWMNKKISAETNTLKITGYGEALKYLNAISTDVVNYLEQTVKPTLSDKNLTREQMQAYLHTEAETMINARLPDLVKQTIAEGKTDVNKYVADLVDKKIPATVQQQKIAKGELACATELVVGQVGEVK